MRPAFTLFCVMTLAIALSACGFRESHSYRYRVMVEVETPQGLRTGSEVWETKAVEGTGIPDTARRLRSRGQAVAVDLPTGTLFAVLRDDKYGVDYPNYVVSVHLRAHPDPQVPISPDWKQVMPAIKQAKPAFELYPDEYPLLVYFRDPSISSSVERVEPADFEAAFGPGTRLRRIVISVTDDRLSDGSIRSRLKWLSSAKDSDHRLKPHGPDDWSLPATLRHADFVRGL